MVYCNIYLELKDAKSKYVAEKLEGRAIINYDSSTKTYIIHTRIRTLKSEGDYNSAVFQSSPNVYIYDSFSHKVNVKEYKKGITATGFSYYITITSLIDDDFKTENYKTENGRLISLKNETEISKDIKKFLNI